MCTRQIHVVMNRGKEPVTSVCEKEFILEAVKERKRLDGREVYDFRNVAIELGGTPGTVTVQLGGTRVLACVSCEVVTPRPQRPSEGLLHFNVHLSPMGSPSFEIGGRPGPLATELGQILERCFKESRAVDTESLCIIASEKVWSIRVEVHVLDHNGNLIDAASLAAITALKYFRRPDVTVVGEEATIHPVSERVPVPLNVHHIPLCVTFAFFCDGQYLAVDPNLEEEGVMEGRMTIAMNTHQEVCVLQLTGGVAILPDQVLRCSQIAAVKVGELTKLVKNVFSEKSQVNGGDDMSLLVTEKVKQTVKVPDVSMDTTQDGEHNEDIELVVLGTQTAMVGEGGASSWLVEDDDVAMEEEESTSNDKVREGDNEEEEEETVTLTGMEVGGFQSTELEEKAVPSAADNLKSSSSKRQKSKGKKEQKLKKRNGSSRSKQ